MDKGVLEGIRGQGCDILEDGGSGVLRCLGDAKEFLYSGKYLIIRSPSLDDMGCPFDRISSYRILFYPIFFSPYSWP